MHNSTPTPSDLTELMSKCSMWYVRGQTFSGFERVGPGVDIVHTFPYEAFEQLDARLPSLLLHMQRMDELKLNEKLPMVSLWKTLEHWSSPLPEVTDDSGETYVIGELHSVTDSKDVFILKSTIVRRAEFQCEDAPEPVSYIKKSLGNINLFVTPEELEKRFPGWSNRVKTVESLELTGRARFQCLFQQSTVLPNVSMPNFD